MPKKIAVVGGGPSSLFILNELVIRNDPRYSLDIFEAGDVLGVGMPYSREGSNSEHMTNLSCEEIPDLAQTLEQWLDEQTPELLEQAQIDPRKINELSIMPRLLFGKYLNDQMQGLLKIAKEKGLAVNIHTQCPVVDIVDIPDMNKTQLVGKDHVLGLFDHIVIATGHVWNKTHEGKIKDYFDSPYPPQKLSHIFNQQVALRGASLTAVDAIKTVAKTNGEFVRSEDGELLYKPFEGTENFKIVMHTRQGILPGLRFHFDHPRVLRDKYLSQAQIEAHLLENNGKVSLDFVFEQGFKAPLVQKDPEFHSIIKDMNLDEFVEYIFEQKRQVAPFDYFSNELKISKVSLMNHEPVHWKEMVAFLSSASNFLTKHMPAEDVIRIHQNLMPLVANVIAHLPHDSSEELIAMHRAGKLDLVAVGKNSKLSVDADKPGATYSYISQGNKKESVSFDVFVDCLGQQQVPFEAFPFKTLVEQGTVRQASAVFASSAKAQALQDAPNGLKISQGPDGQYRLDISGLEINDNFQVVGSDGKSNPRISIMAIPFMGGLNPDFSGLDFCEDAAQLVVDGIQYPTSCAAPLSAYAPVRRMA